MKLQILASILGVGLMAVACGDDEESVTTTGTLEVVTLTTGADIDADGYTVAIDGEEGPAVGANSSVTVPNLTAAEYTVGLLGIALNCQTTDNSRSASVVAGQTESTVFDVACVAANQPPVADPGQNQTVVDENDDGSESVTLDGSGSTDSDGNVVRWRWSVNQVEIGTGQMLTVPAPVGVHTVALTVTDDGGAIDTEEVIITVQGAPDANQPPVADAGPNQAVVDADDGGSETVTLDASGSTDADGNIVSWSWAENGVAIGTGETLDATFDVGVHTVTLTVTDDDGDTDTDNVIIAVVASGANVPPVADAGPNQTVEDADDGGSETVTLDASGSTDADGTIVSWSWTENGLAIGTGETLDAEFDVGVHTVTLTVTDDDGDTDTDDVRITVNASTSNLPPVADAGQNQEVLDADDSGFEDVTLDASGSVDTDGEIRTWDWSEGGVVFGTGETLTVGFQVGEHTVTLTVTDDDGAANTDEVIITVNADSDDRYSVCRRAKCAFDQELANRCTDFMNTCLATQPDATKDNCPVAALLICNEVELEPELP